MKASIVRTIMIYPWSFTGIRHSRRRAEAERFDNDFCIYIYIYIYIYISTLNMISNYIGVAKHVHILLSC